MTQQEKALLVVMKSAQKKVIHRLHGRPSKQNQHGGVEKRDVLLQNPAWLYHLGS